MFDIKGFLNSSRRVITVSKKPDWNEFKTMAKVTGLGIIVIALIGFVVMLIMHGSGLGA